MANLIRKQNEDINESFFQGFDLLSIFDEQFSIEDFERTLNRDRIETENVLSKTRAAIKNAYESNDDDSYHYEVSMTDDLKLAIENGEVNLVTGKDGAIYAQLRGEKGRFGKPLPIEKQLEEQGLTVEQIQMAMQIDAIRSQLEDMISQLKSIEGHVTEIIQGQHNDRIGLFFSGLSLYAESQNISDSTLRTQIQSQSLKALSDANAQVIQEIRTCMEYLLAGKYKGCKDAPSLIEEHLSSISKCYDVVYRATFLKAAIYFEKGELGAMLTTIDEYGRFVQKMVIPYAGKLSELDRNEKFIEKGTWGKIASTVSICGEMRKQLSTERPMLLSMKGEHDG